MINKNFEKKIIMGENSKKKKKCYNVPRSPLFPSKQVYSRIFVGGTNLFFKLFMKNSRDPKKRAKGPTWEWRVPGEKYSSMTTCRRC